MRIVVALGGNALLRRGEPLSADNQRRNVRRAAKALAGLVRAGHQLVVTHGNGPQVGLLALQGEAYKGVAAYPLDVLGAESEGMIGYMIEQELSNLLGGQPPVATLLTQVEVDAHDPAFAAPSKPIGPVYTEDEARRIVESRHWHIAPDGKDFRRVVASPAPQRILEIGVIRLLLDAQVIVICGGGGGIPVVRRPAGGFTGVEAVIDKDRASALLAQEIEADALVMLTDVATVFEGFGTPDARAIRQTSPAAIAAFDFPAGSMGPKVEAACAFAQGRGGWAAIGRLEDAEAIVAGTAGTRIDAAAQGIEWYA